MIPIIMCTWQRIHNFKKTIDLLNAQKNCEIELYVWNNNIEYVDELESTAKSSNFKISFYHSKNNIGGFGRFYFAKAIAEKFKNIEYCIFIDDDQIFDDTAICELYEERAKNTIVSQYGWIFNSINYYDRYQPAAGSIVNYAGTGGMVVDIDIFKKEILYQCPSEYWAIEDLWLSFCAQKYFNCKLIQSKVKMQQYDDDMSLHYLISELKIEMLNSLVYYMGFKIGKKKK